VGLKRRWTLKNENLCRKHIHWLAILKDLEERPFQAEDVEEWLRNTEDTALTLYWSRARPRK